jgi:RNA polymerase sigma-70 factor (ECF subfamily)
MQVQSGSSCDERIWTRLEPFGELVEAFHGRIYGYCLGLCKDSERAKDLTQDVFLRAHRYRESFQEGRSVAPWLFRMARNVCCDYFRQKRGDLSLEAGLVSATEELRKELQTRLSVPSHEAQVDARLVVRAALDRLEPKARATIYLRYFEHLSIKEIALALDDKESAVKVRLMRTRRLLAEILRQEVHAS